MESVTSRSLDRRRDPPEHLIDDPGTVRLQATDFRFFLFPGRRYHITRHPCLGRSDLLVSDAPQLPREPKLAQGPDHPLGGIELPPLHPIAIVVLKLVMVVVVPLAKGEQGHDPAVTRGATL